MIRVATEFDIPRIAEIHALAWHEAYRQFVAPEFLARATTEARLATWRQWFGHTEQWVHTLELDGEVIGFSRIALPQQPTSGLPNYGELSHLYQDPTKIGSGIGHQLFEHAKEFIAEAGQPGMLLWTLEKNTRARRFYERHGMVADGQRKDEPDWLGEGVYEVRYVIRFELPKE